MPHLIGQAPIFTFFSWEQKINSDGYIIVPPRQRHYNAWNKMRDDEDDYLGESEPEREFTYYQFSCDYCHKTFLFRSEIQRGFSDYEQVYCPQCRKSFGEIRADLSYSFIGEVNGDLGNTMSQSIVSEPFQDIVSKHILSTQKEWRRWRITKESCTICGRELATSESQTYTNPVNGSPICAECLTAGRWLMTLR